MAVLASSANPVESAEARLNEFETIAASVIVVIRASPIANAATTFLR